MKYTNITVSGQIGSGSTTLAKGLAQSLGFEYVSVGEIFRKLVAAKNLPLITSLPASWDYQMEKQLKKRLQNEEGLVIEGHYQGWNAKDLINTFRILVKCDPKVSAERVKQRTGNLPETPNEIAVRKQKHQQIFKERYGNDDFLNPKYYHLVIDTTYKSIKETLDLAISKFQEAKP